MPYRAITSANSVRGTGYIGAVLAVDDTSAPAVRVSDCAADCVGACKQPIAARRTTADAKRVFITGLRIVCCKQDRRLVLDIPVPALTVPPLPTVAILPPFCLRSKQNGQIQLNRRGRAGWSVFLVRKDAPAIAALFLMIRARVAPPIQNATCVRMTTASNLPPTGVPRGVPGMPPPAAVEKRLLMSPCR